MNKNMYKLIALSMLIALSVIQTIGLWLGEPLSHNFFGSLAPRVLEPIRPESIWLNTGGEYTRSYRITDIKNEYDSIIDELQEVLLNFEDFYNIEHNIGDWDKIFNQKGIVFEYSVQITLDEVIGKSIALPYNYKIDSIFIRIGGDNNIFFINETENYFIEISPSSNEFASIYSLFDVDNRESVSYQPSVKDIKAQHIKGNVFLANTSEAMPLKYSQIVFENNLLGNDNQMAVLESYVDQFFEKPIMKEIRTLYGGKIEFTEPMKSIVRYDDKGVIQYINLNLRIDARPMSRLEGYNIAVDFINQIQSMSSSVKENLYLSSVNISQGAYVFNFDIIYNDHKVHISQNFKNLTDMDAAVTIMVKENNQKFLPCGLGLIGCS